MHWMLFYPINFLKNLRKITNWSHKNADLSILKELIVRTDLIDCYLNVQFKRMLPPEWPNLRCNRRDLMRSMRSIANDWSPTHPHHDVFDLICKSDLISAPWWRRRLSCVRFISKKENKNGWKWKRNKIQAKKGFFATMRNGMRKMVGMFVFFLQFLKLQMKICTIISGMSLTFYGNFAMDFF